jgi:hypothetical protein
MSNLVDRDCPICGKTYTANTTRLKHGRQTTCSRACSYKFRASALSNSKKYSCAVCGNEVLRCPSRLRSKFVFCSNSCHYKGRSMGLVLRTVTTPYNVTEAGREAWRKANAKRKGTPYLPMVEWDCENCGKRSSITRGDLAPARKLRFCSNKCATEAMRGDGNPAWRGGHRHYYGPDWRPLRKLCRELDNHSCQRCDTTRAEVERELDVHHIEPVSSFEIPNDANVIENLVTLCHDCHMLVEWNGVDFELPDRCRNRAEVLNGRPRTSRKR